VIAFNPIFGYIAAGALAAGGLAGWKVRDWQCDAAATKAYAKAERQRQEMQDAVDERSRAYEGQRDQADRLGAFTVADIRTVYRQVPAPSVDCAADPRVVGMLQGGVDRANAGATGKSGE